MLPSGVADAVSRGASYRRRPSTRKADQRKLRPFAANTVSALVTASRSPPSAGPRKVPMLSSVLDVTFAAVSSDGVRTSRGSNADCAGRNTVPATVVSATSAYTTAAGPPDAIVPAAASMSAQRARSLDTITATRGKRSTSDDVNGAAIAAGMSLMSPTRPTAAAPPWSYA